MTQPTAGGANPLDSTDPAALEALAIFRSLRREVWVITASEGLRRGGLTATWVQSASLDPARPVLVAALSVNHYTTQLVEASGRFVANLLAADQAALGLRFALSSGHEVDKLAGLEIRLTPGDLPRLETCRAWLEVRVFARLRAGSRHYYWGEVTAAAAPGAGPPLIDADLFAAATAEERGVLARQLQLDLQLHRPEDERWRTTPPPEVAWRPPPI